ncbi:UBX domain-containing protein 4 [Hemiscyllium ocellatum]|uniref:UBX domain-containing protein 4 n=1 Tax=Hemiscyllium ocellatum TaxID=170820 RepID=UPI0029664D9D|nr:UBX domain-containing protein 4 [Hemiscyllium ocellatum]
MHWFNGSIPDAIAFAKQQNAVFIVFIRGDDEQSARMAASWEAEEVVDATVNSFVAIKIDAKSETCVQFAQIYPVVCIPSSFFIGDNGIPLEVIAGSVTAVELVSRIQKVNEMHRQKNVAAAAAGDNQENHVGQSQASTSEASGITHQNEPQVSDLKTTETLAATGPQVRSRESPSKMSACSDHSDHADSPGRYCVDEYSVPSQTEEDLNVRVERLTKKLEERREQKKEDELTNEIKVEIERRKVGKEMVEFKRKQEEDRTKRMLEERSRDKEEERLARERIRQQIALDRAERAARYAKTKEEAEAARKAAELQRQATEEARNKKERSNMCRIQFRLPDGSSFTNQFSADATLLEARQFAESQVGGVYGHFELAITFPRKQFTKDDYSKTLTELELVPSASIILVPGGRSTSSMIRSSEGGLWAFLNTLFYPVIAVWRFLSNYLFASDSTHRSPRINTSPSHLESLRVAPSDTSDTDREVRRRRLLERRGEDFKREGRIYRLRTEDDADDDNNTWNGNSTQQM